MRLLIRMTLKWKNIEYYYYGIKELILTEWELNYDLRSEDIFILKADTAKRIVKIYDTSKLRKTILFHKLEDKLEQLEISHAT